MGLCIYHVFICRSFDNETPICYNYDAELAGTHPGLDICVNEKSSGIIPNLNGGKESEQQKKTGANGDNRPFDGPDPLIWINTHWIY